MYILAFETSCDDTSVAVFRDNVLISMSTYRQIEEHQITQGVVPEVAARIHTNVIGKTLTEALDKAQITLHDISAIGCTDRPGLLPSLLVGMTVAKTIASAYHIPIYYLDHIRSHIYANYIDRPLDAISFPAICLTVSGGHNEIYLWHDIGTLEKIGQTLDDAAGEAFDKVAKMMGLGFPGGPIISQLATQHVGPSRIQFPRAWLDEQSLNFSFSGLKSAVKRYIDELEILDEPTQQSIAHAFQEAVIDVLATKTVMAAKKYNVQTVVLAGGVSANDQLNTTLKEMLQGTDISCIAPAQKVFSQDNAAMVGIHTYLTLQHLI